MVAIHGDDHVTARVIEAWCQGRCLSKIASQLNHLYAAVLLVDRPHALETLISATVVYKYQLPRNFQLLKGFSRTLVDHGEVIFLVVDRDDH